MSKKESNDNGLMGLGEISTIRNILMGQQISEYQEKFNGLERRIERLEKELKDKTDTLKKLNQEESKNINKELTSQVTRLEKSIIKQGEIQEKKLIKTSNSDRVELGKMLSELSRKLMG